MHKWSKKFELQYWNAEADQYYIDNLRQKYSFFDVDNFIDENVNLAIDIGGGKFGGALYLFRDARRSILVDLLANEFRKTGKLPEHVEIIASDFSDIPLDSFCANVIFAWNVYDHANNEKHFISGMLEVKRLLKPNGLFFGSFPLRLRSRNGHPFCITEKMISQQFDVFHLIKDFVIGEPYYRDKTLFLIVKK